MELIATWLTASMHKKSVPSRKIELSGRRGPIVHVLLSGRSFLLGSHCPASAAPVVHSEHSRNDLSMLLIYCNLTG